MAPLDMGSVTHTLRLVDTAGRSSEPSPTHYDTLGAYLKSVREQRGVSLIDLAKDTRVSRRYLAAIEAGDRAILPSRPFAIGYVRAYAQALGVDGETAVARFKTDWPEITEPLRNPGGMGHDTASRRPLIYVAVGVLVAAVGLWNVAQRTLIRDLPRAADLPAIAAPEAATAPIKVSAPSEAPPESTVPAPYVTPGLDVSTPPATPGAPEPAGTAANVVKPAPAVFVTRGEVFGTTPAAATVILQARKPVSLIVHGVDKTVYFARQLKVGQAYRAPLGRNLTADLSDPAAVDVYIGGRLAPALASDPALLDKLPAPAPPPAPVAAAAPVPVSTSVAGSTPVPVSRVVAVRPAG